MPFDDWNSLAEGDQKVYLHLRDTNLDIDLHGSDVKPTQLTDTKILQECFETTKVAIDMINAGKCDIGKTYLQSKLTPAMIDEFKNCLFP